MRRYSGFFSITFFGLVLILGLLSGCKSEPSPNPVPVPAQVPAPAPPPPQPSSFSLVYKGVEADDPVHLRVLFVMEAEPPLLPESSAKVAAWRVEIDGQDAGDAFSWDYPQAAAFSLNPSVPISLNMDVNALTAKGLAPKDEYNVTLITELDYSHGAATPEKIEVRGLAFFPGVQPPKFNITEIAILQAELVNTRFRVALKIDNPNPFPIELSSFSYTLYGNGRFWADGAERNVLRIREKSSLEGTIIMLMNFIDMDRNLLNQFTRLENVNYRFTGDVRVSTGVDYLPVFNDGFDVSGYSKVLER